MLIITSNAKRHVPTTKIAVTIVSASLKLATCSKLYNYADKEYNTMHVVVELLT